MGCTQVLWVPWCPKGRMLHTEVCFIQEGYIQIDGSVPMASGEMFNNLTRSTYSVKYAVLCCEGPGFLADIELTETDDEVGRRPTRASSQRLALHVCLYLHKKGAVVEPFTNLATDTPALPHQNVLSHFIRYCSIVYVAQPHQIYPPLAVQRAYMLCLPCPLRIEVHANE